MKKTLLVVDDIPLMRTMLKKYLHVVGPRIFGDAADDGGVTVLEAGNGEEALQVLAAHGGAIDCIFLDMMMPDLDGVGFMERKRRDATLAHVPVIVTTALSGDGAVQQALDLGARAYVRKPFTIKAIEDVLQGIVREATH